jgi:MFS family permease
MPANRPASDTESTGDMSSVAKPAAGRDVKILGLVSAGHFLSHFYAICLPPLFLFISRDLGVSFALLGLLMSVRSFTSGIMQVPAGMLVDRIGARPVLIGGMILMAGATALSALAPSYWALMGLSVMMSLGNSVFHPTDYAILNASVSRSYVGRAFSVHTFAGQLGTATAPAVVVALAHFSDWRMAQAVIGLAGFVVLALMAMQWNHMHDDAIPEGGKDKPAGRTAKDTGGQPTSPPTSPWAILLSRPMLIMSAFFTMTALQSGGMNSFFVVGLTSLHGTSAAAAGTALSAYLLAAAGGTLLGGVLADYSSRHDLTSAAAFAVSAAILLFIVLSPPGDAVLIAVMGLSGLMQGAIRPARDMMVRAAVPPNAIGKAFGFVSSGTSIGGSVAPVIFGWLIDIGRPDLVFWLLIAFTVLCVLASVAPKEYRSVAVR